MSANQPTSFRYPFNLAGKVHPEAEGAIRYAFSGLKDLNDAVRSLSNKINAIPATPAAAAATTTIVAGGSSAFPNPSAGAVNDQTNQTAYTIQQSDYGALILLNDASPITITLNSGVTTPFFTFIENLGSATANLIPDQATATINNIGDLGLPSAMSAIVFFDGHNWWATTFPLVVTGTFFLDNAASDIATYKQLITAFPSVAEASLVAAGNAAAGNVLIGTFATNPSVPSATLIPMGMWIPSFYASVDSVAQGPQVIVQLFTRTSGGTETLQTTINIPLTAVATTFYDISTEVGNVGLSVTDRIVAKFYLLAGGPSTRTVTLYFDGTTHASHLHVPSSIYQRLPVLRGTSGNLGGSAMTAGQTITATVSVIGATSGMAVALSPSTYPGDGFVWDAYVSSADTVTVRLTATLSGTPTTSTYNVRVIQ